MRWGRAALVLLLLGATAGPLLDALHTHGGATRYGAPQLFLSAAMINAKWHKAHLMPKNATPKQRLAWHLQHQKHCGCRKLTDAQRLKLVEAAKK